MNQLQPPLQPPIFPPANMNILATQIECKIIQNVHEK